MRLLTTPDSDLRLSDALGHMAEALAILDELDAPGEIGSMLDHAIEKLKIAGGQGERSSSNVQLLIEQLDREMSTMPESVTVAPNPWEIQPI